MSAKNGATPLYKTVEEMQVKIDEYFKEKCGEIYAKDDEGNVLQTVKGNPVVEFHPPTVAGLALHLGFMDRHSIYDYGKKGDFSHTVKSAITSIEEFAEKRLYANNCTGAIFWLKNHGWRDNKVIEVNLDEERKKNILGFLDDLDEE